MWSWWGVPRLGKVAWFSNASQEITHDAVWDWSHISERLFNQCIIVVETSIILNIIDMNLKPIGITYYLYILI